MLSRGTRHWASRRRLSGPARGSLAAGRVAVAPLVEAMYPLDHGLEAFAHAARPGALKVLLSPGS
jgi:hypothetical protein